MLENIAKEARRDIVKMVAKAGAGHPGGSLSCIDILTYLYHKEIKLNLDNVDSNNRDQLVLSKGHAAPALYAALCSVGVLSKEELLTLRKINSDLQGHPNMNDTKGVDMSTGSLGQGISAAVGMAIANKVKGSKYNVYAVCGDGEFQEGQVYEALMSAAHYKLDNFIVVLDYNGLQIDGKISDVMNSAPFKEKFEAFGFDVFEIDGHNFNEIENAVNLAKKSNKPAAIVARTVKGKGVSFMENNAGWHGKAPNDEELEKALNELGGE